MALNNVAWADLMLAKPELLEEAARYSSEAIAPYGKVAPFLGTRGFALIELGQLDEGIELLRGAFRTNIEAESRALNACCLSMGFARNGMPDEALGWIEQARQLDPHCLLLPRAVAQAEAGATVWTSAAPELVERLAAEHEKAAHKIRKSHTTRVLLFAVLVFLAVLALLRFKAGD